MSFGSCDFHIRSAIIVNKRSLENFDLKTKRSLECSNESTATTILKRSSACG